MPRLIRTSNDIGRIVREARLRKSLTQAEVAHALGVTQKWISTVEGGKDTAPIGAVLRLLDSLGVGLTAEGTADDSAENRMRTERHETATVPSAAGKTAIDAVLAAHRNTDTTRTPSNEDDA